MKRHFGKYRPDQKEVVTVTVLKVEDRYKYPIYRFWVPDERSLVSFDLISFGENAHEHLRLFHRPTGGGVNWSKDPDRMIWGGETEMVDSLDSSILVQLKEFFASGKDWGKFHSGEDYYQDKK